jgi:hypothetical protein
MYFENKFHTDELLITIIDEAIVINFVIPNEQVTILIKTFLYNLFYMKDKIFIFTI